MYYIINVSRGGQHLFATAEHSLTTPTEFLACREIFLKKFPEEEGYTVTCTRWETSGTPVPDEGKYSCP